MKKIKNQEREKYAPPLTIIIPTHSRKIYDVVKAVKKQKYKGKVTILVLDNAENDRTKEMPKGIVYIKNKRNIGLAGSLNKGIHLAKTDVVITLQQDIIPASDTWLRTLVQPMEDPIIVLSSSKEILPKNVWEKFSFWHKVFAMPQLKAQNEISEHATAYQREILLKVGCFDQETFFSAGEDTDLFFKMEKHGKLIVSNALVYHVHAPHNDSLWKFMGTFMRCHEGMGVLHRKYLFRMGFQFWYDALKTVLTVLMIVFLFYNAWVTLVLFIITIILSNITHINTFMYIKDIRLFAVPFVYTFVWYVTLFVTWKGFITGKESIK